VEQAVELAVIFVALLPFARLLTCRPFLRRLATAPGPAIGGITAVTAVVGISLWAAFYEPWLLRSLAAGSAIALAVGWWRARPDFGTARGLPPGSLSVASLGPWVDQDFYAKQAARHGPIFKTATVLKPTVGIVGWPLAIDLFRNHDASLIAPAAPFSKNIPREFVRYMNDPDHATYSPILRRAVSASITSRAESRIGELARTEFRLAADDSDERKGGIVAAELVWRIVLRAFLLLFYGTDPSGPDADRLSAMYRELDPLRAWRVTGGRVRSAVDELARFARANATEDSFIGSALRGQAGDDETLVKNLVYMVQTSYSDVAGLLTWTVWQLSRQPDLIERLRKSDDLDSAARRVVLETLRLEQSEYLLRQTTRDISWQGYRIPRGWRVRVCVHENHRDPRSFPDPTRFDPDRFRGSQPTTETYSAFGTAPTRTSCSGPAVTLTLGRIFVLELVGGFDLTVERDGPPEFSGVHWRPSARFQIALKPRPDLARVA
jgi:cytochrome P450